MGVDDKTRESLDKTHDGNVVIVEKKRIVPDGGWGWFVVLGCLLLRTVVGPLVSVLCNRFSCRKLSYFGAALYIIGIHISAYANSLLHMYFSYGVVGGIGRAFVLTPCTILLGEYFDKRRSLAFGLASAGFGIGGFAITPIVEILFQEYGFMGTYILLSGMACHLFICIALFRPVELVKMDGREDVDNIEECGLNNTDHLVSKISSTGSVHLSSNISDKDKYDAKATDSEKLALQSENNNENINNDPDNKNQSNDNSSKKKLISFSILKDVRFLTLCVATFIFILPSTGLFLPALAKSRGLTDIQTAYLLSIIAGCDTVSRVISGFILDFERVRTLRPYIYNSVSFVQCLALFAIPSLNSFPEFAAICCLHGTVMGIKAAQRSVILVDILGVDKLSSSFAILLVFQGIGTLIGPPMAGLLKDTYGKYDYTFYFGGSAVFIGAVILACGNIKNFYNKRKINETKRTSDI